MIEALFPHQVTVQRPTPGVDRAGTPVLDYSQCVDVVVTRAFVQQPQPGREDTNLRQATIASYTVFLPPEVDVTAADRIQWDGNTLEVTGPPALKYRPEGLHHLSVPASQVVG